MAEPARKIHPEIEPDIRPRFGVIQGGGESTPERGNLHAVDDDSTAQDLSNQERRFGVIQGGGESTPERGNLRDVSENIDNTRQEEQNGNWATDVSNNSGNNGGKNKVTGLMQQAKKKGPLGTIIALVGGGGLIGGGLLSPAGALIHIKEILVNKFDTMSSVMEERSTLAMSKRLFGTNTTCKIKVRCRFNGLTNRQMERLRIQGAEVLDKDGKAITRNKLGRYTGGKTLVLPDGTRVEASAYKKTLRTNPVLRDLSRTVFASRFLSWNDKISKDIRAKKRLVTNPDWGNGDEKEARKSVFKATSGESYSAETQDNQKTTKDANGNDTKERGVDYGDYTDTINEEADALKKKAESGDLVPSIPSDPAGAVAMAETPLKSSALKSVIGVLNPADILVGLCTTYQITNALVLTAKTIALANAMRYASQFLSTADKIKAGEATATDAEQAMIILERADQYGDAFGDSVGYQYAEYGQVPDKSIASSAVGNGVILVLSAALRWVNNMLGGGKTVRTACRILSNPLTQVALSLTTFIPGGGQAAKAASAALNEGAKVAAKEIIDKAVAKIIKSAAEKLSKDALKKTAKEASKQFVKMAASAAGMFLAGYLVQRYAIPYLARELSGTMLTGSENGVTSMDTMANGFDATNQATAQERGLMPLGKDDVASFNEFNSQSTATYVADMRAQSNPFDITDPYSASNSLASTFYTFASKVKNSSLLSLPATILSGLNIQSLLGNNASAAQDTDYCNDDYLKQRGIAASPFCNAVMGFNDTNMLETADPDDTVTTYMLDHKQIDNDGNPVAGSRYADFVNKCIAPAGDKYITDLGDENTQLDETCTDVKLNRTTERKMFYLYHIDDTVVNAMDQPSSGDTTAFYDTSAPLVGFAQ